MNPGHRFAGVPAPAGGVPGLVIALTLASGLAAIAAAEEVESVPSPPTWSAGYTLGLTNTAFDGALGDSIPQSQYGFGFGVFVSYPFAPRLRFQPEILLSVRGGTFKQPVYAFYVDSSETTAVHYGDEHRTVDLTYIELPLLLDFSFGSLTGSVRPHVQGGISPAFRLLGRFRGGTYTGTEPVNPDDASRFDLSWMAVLGADVRTRRALLRFDVRYTQGTLDVFPEDKGPPGRNRAWSLVLGINP